MFFCCRVYSLMVIVKNLFPTKGLSTLSYVTLPTQGHVTNLFRQQYLYIWSPTTELLPGLIMFWFQNSKRLFGCDNSMLSVKLLFLDMHSPYILLLLAFIWHIWTFLWVIETVWKGLFVTTQDLDSFSLRGNVEYQSFNK